VTQEKLEELVEEGLLRPITDVVAPEWIRLEEGVDVPNPPTGYILSFVAFHERGLGILASRFLWVLPSWYEVELYNFNPNSISQAAIFVAICEGYLGIPPIGTSGSTSSRQSTSPRLPRADAHRRW
jgi:hypothetical protein